MHSTLPIYQLRADSGELGPQGCLKLVGYHELLGRIIEDDLASQGNSLSHTLAHGYAWAMVSLSMQVKRPVSSCEQLCGQSWLSQCEYPYHRREIQLFTAAGELVLSASVFMAPISTATHKIQPEDELVPTVFRTLQEYSAEWAQARMHSIHDERYQLLDVRTVRPSDIDALGHLNNCRYGAFAYDALESLGRNITAAPFRYTMHFMRQCMAGTQVSIGAYEERGAVHLLGVGREDKLKRFCAVIKEI